jgi:ferritin-like metal-binding protein YciE
VPFAIVDDRGAREAIWKLATYADTLSTLHELCSSIDGRLKQAEQMLARTEALVADRAHHELSTAISARLTETEEAVRHIERVVSSGPPDELFTLQTLCINIDKRLAQVEDALGRTEEHVADRTLQELSARIAARLTETEDAVRRIEAALHDRSAAPTIDRSAVAQENPWVVGTTSDQQTEQPPPQRRVTIVATTVVLAAVLLVIAPTRVPIRVAAQPTPLAEQPPAAPIVEQQLPAPTPPAERAQPIVSTPPPAPTVAAPAPRRRAPAAAAVRTTSDDVAPASPVRFIGDLSITSTPPGARVFVNGRAVGVTPLVLHEQRAGSVAVQIVSEGFERWSASVSIPAGQVTRVAATLRASRPQ